MVSEAGNQLGVEAARRLAQRHRRFEPGLTDAEFDRIERAYGFEFADDHRAFLAAGLPVDDGPTEGRWTLWPDWRNGDPDKLRERLAQPVDGVLFDVEHNRFWYKAWGDRPTDTQEALATARTHLARVPRMVPVYSHRCVPAGRGTWGHPVLSIMQTDVIYYGTDLADFVYQQFGGPCLDRMDERWDPQATVEFWSYFV